MSELFPDKFTRVENTVVGEAAALLANMADRSVSVGQLYIEHLQNYPTATYDSFCLALTFLYGAGILDYDDQILRVV